MKRFFTYALLINTLFLFNCSNDDDNSPSSETNLSEIIRMITANGNAKTWKIENAALTNSNTQNLDISTAFNIKDDEFIFTTNASSSALILEHRQRHGFNKDAESFQEFLLEHNKTSLNYNLNPQTNANNQFSDANGIINLHYEENMINGEWLLDTTTKLTFTLTEKTASEYQTAPESLNFEDVITIPSEFSFFESMGSADVLASLANNTIYMVYSTDTFENPNGEIPRAEAIIRYNTINNTFTHSLFHHSDFFTKRAIIRNNELKVIGTQFLNTYNLNIDSEPIIDPYNDAATIDLNYFHHIIRYDTINYEDTLFVLGGNNSDEATNPESVEDKIFTLNTSSPHLVELATMPGPKSMAASELVDNTIYTFSGQRKFQDTTSSETTCYQFDLENNSFTSFNISQALNISFTTSIEHLIFVAGQIFVLNENNQTTDINAFLGVYNTLDNTFNEITHNLDDSDTSSRIHGITNINNELYVVFGNNNSANEGVTKLLKASL